MIIGMIIWMIIVLQFDNLDDNYLNKEKDQTDG